MSDSQAPPDTTSPSTNAPKSIPFVHLNPYQSMRNDSEHLCRVTLDMDRRDVDLIRSVLVRQGSYTTAIYLFIKSISDYARTNNLTLADAKRLEQHIIDTTEFGRAGASKFFERECQRALDTPVNITYPTAGPTNNSIGPSPSIPNSKIIGGPERLRTSPVHPRDQGQTNQQHSGVGEQAPTTQSKGKRGSGGGKSKS